MRLSGDKFLVAGHVRSRENGCVYARLVKLIGHRPNGTQTRVDFDVTSLHGAWAAKVHFSGFDRVKAKTIKTGTENGDVCGRAAVVFSAP